jgi:hypothetical protein
MPASGSALASSSWRNAEVLTVCELFDTGTKASANICRGRRPRRRNLSRVRLFAASVRVRDFHALGLVTVDQVLSHHSPRMLTSYVFGVRALRHGSCSFASAKQRSGRSPLRASRLLTTLVKHHEIDLGAM